MKRVLKIAAVMAIVLGLIYAGLVAAKVVEQRGVDEPVAVEEFVETESGESAEAAYAGAKEELRSALEEKKEDLDPEMYEAVEEDLTVIESAVVNILSALSDDPESESLRRMLVQTYRNEIRLLKHALYLSDEDEEEAFLDEAVEGEGASE